jgi:hypothetical protein
MAMYMASMGIIIDAFEPNFQEKSGWIRYLICAKRYQIDSHSVLKTGLRRGRPQVGHYDCGIPRCSCPPPCLARFFL